MKRNKMCFIQISHQSIEELQLQTTDSISVFEGEEFEKKNI
jgi:hypothetical protein